MKRTRHSAEQIVKKLHEAATALAGGKTVEDVCKRSPSPMVYGSIRAVVVGGE